MTEGLSPRFFQLLTLCLVCVVTAGCYSVSARAIPSGIRTIAIPLFQDATIETDLKERLTDVIIARFLSNNQLRVVDARDADALIIGTILEVRDESVAFAQGQSARESRIWITAQVRFEDTRNRKTLWEEERLQAFGVYSVQTGSLDEREIGVTAAINKLAEDILNKTVAGW